MEDVSSHAIAAGAVKALYTAYLLRLPSPDELTYWVEFTLENSVEQLQRKIIDSPEHVKQAKQKFPSGHYYSPIVNSAGLKFADPMSINPDELHGISLSVDRLRMYWKDLSQHMGGWSFPHNKTNEFLYYFNNNVYSYADGLTLRAMIRKYRPKRIVEIGSGFSSACIIDTILRDCLTTKDVKFIDPDPKRYNDLMAEVLDSRFVYIKDFVQNVDLQIFERLEAGDILFIDSSHVLKTKSDVCYELFEILPILKSGVVIHFHDIFYPFEYPRRWVEEGFSWNELYALRLFLMDNHRYEILWFNHMAGLFLQEEILDVCPDYLRNIGGSIYIQKK